MMSDETFQEFQCVASTRNKHFLKDPIRLVNCKHCVCRSCLSEETVEINCSICGIVTELNLRNIQIAIDLKQSLISNLGRIFEKIQKETISSLNQLKNYLSKFDEFLEIKMSYIEEEIDIRVESIKVEVEEAGEQLKKRIREMKTELKKVNEIETKTRINNFNINLNELQNNIQNKTNLNEELLHKIEKNLKSINEYIDVKKRPTRIPEINISNEKSNFRIVEELYYFRDVDVVGLLLNGEQEIFDLDNKPFDIIAFPKNRLLLCNFNCFTIFDENLNFIEKIEEINYKKFRPFGVALNYVDERLYIKDSKNHLILMTDFEFSLIKSVDYMVSTNEEFKGGGDMCFANSNLYLYHTDYKRVHVYSKDLEFIKFLKMKMDDIPWKIKISNSILFAQSTQGIHFYNLNDFSLIQRSSHGMCRMSKINTNIYELNAETKKLFCYDQRGNLKEEANLTSFNQYITNIWDGAFVEFNGMIIMISWTNDKIIKFSKD